ncbi:MAG TPA: NAD(+) diphosphatase [Myxococcales bacterium]|nr:NAD(+) diphosphatase [Myxococcales bacterium]
MQFIPGCDPPDLVSTQALFFLCHDEGLVVRRDRAHAQLPLPLSADLPPLGVDAALSHYLGKLDGQECFVLPFEGDPGSAFEIAGLRRLYGEIDEALFWVAGRAMQVAHWAQTHRFCGRCATPTERLRGERCLRCPRCALGSYPRISPAIIVLVRRGAQALLARSSRFPSAFFSTLAGFVEVGESLEETVVREVREEVGIEVARPRYFGSQPWPFPHSLMLGFMAEYAGGEVRVDGQEILEARWFAPNELPRIPPPLSIARKLIDAWVAEATAAS